MGQEHERKQAIQEDSRRLRRITVRRYDQPEVTYEGRSLSIDLPARAVIFREEATKEERIMWLGERDELSIKELEPPMVLPVRVLPKELN